MWAVVSYCLKINFSQSLGMHERLNLVRAFASSLPILAKLQTKLRITIPLYSWLKFISNHVLTSYCSRRPRTRLITRMVRFAVPNYYNYWVVPAGDCTRLCNGKSHASRYKSRRIAGWFHRSFDAEYYTEKQYPIEIIKAPDQNKTDLERLLITSMREIPAANVVGHRKKSWSYHQLDQYCSLSRKLKLSF
jgi:hypothetical protein